VSWSPDQAEFDRSQLVTFLRAVDRNLPEPLTAIVIGGSAAILGYGSHVRTSDVDLFECPSATSRPSLALVKPPSWRPGSWSASSWRLAKEAGYERARSPE